MKIALILLITGIICFFISKKITTICISKNNKPWISRFTGIIVGLCVAVFFLLAVTPVPLPKSHTSDNNHPPAPAPAPAPAPVKNVSTHIIKTLDITIDEFEKRMNINLKKIGYPLKVNLKLNNKDKSSKIVNFKCGINYNSIIFGSVENKTKKIIYFTIISDLKNTYASSFDSSAIIIAAFSSAIGNNKYSLTKASNIFNKFSNNSSKNSSTLKEYSNKILFSSNHNQDFFNFSAYPM